MKKKFDCVEMKHASQERIRASVRGMTREEEVAFFREGAAEFQKRIEAAREAAAKTAPADSR